MKSITRLATMLIASAILVAPSLAFAAFAFSFGYSSGGGTPALGCSQGDISGVACNILFIINSVLVPVLFALAFIVFLYGVAKTYIFSIGDEEAVKEGHKLILWGVIGFVVMISIWGLVNVVANTFGLSGSSAPILPTSY